MNLSIIGDKTILHFTQSCFYNKISDSFVSLRIPGSNSCFLDFNIMRILRADCFFVQHFFIDLPHPGGLEMNIEMFFHTLSAIFAEFTVPFRILY